MQTEEQRNITEAEEMEKIDLVSWLQDYLSCLKKFWLQFLLIFVIVAGISVSYFEFTYEPVYSAKITYAASGTEYMTVNSAVAKRLSKSIPVLTANDEFKRIFFQRWMGKYLEDFQLFQAIRMNPISFL